MYFLAVPGLFTSGLFMSKSIASRSQSVMLNNYGRLPLAMLRGSGSVLWDESGKRYIDMFAGFGGAGIAGHAHPEIAAALSEQSKTLLCHGNLFTNEPQVALAELLLKYSFPGKIFFCHSGAEANEAALKLVRKRDPNRPVVISFDNCFHGRTFGALSLTPASFQEGCGTMLPGNIKVPYGDIAALRAALSHDTGAIFMEPIQGEGGIHVPDIAFVQEVRHLCDQHNLLLVMDEVWTAPGRTGEWFAYQHFSIQPDIITVAKALGGGTPVAACIVADAFADILGPGTHGCTMGGNPLCTFAALTACRLIERDSLCKRAQSLHARFLELVDQDRPALVTDIRGLGLMIGIELSNVVENKKVMQRALENGLHICVGKGNIIRIAPPLTITDEEFLEGVTILLETIHSFS